MRGHLSSAEKTALWGILFGVGVAIVSLALPLAFEVPAWVWRAVLCMGVAISVTSGAFIAYENFVQHRTLPVRRGWGTAIWITGLLLVAVSVWVAIVVPNPVAAIVTAQQLKDAIKQRPNVTVTQLQPLWLSKDDDLRFNLFWTNQGQRAVRGIQPHFAIGTTNGGTIADKKYDEIIRDLEKKFPPSANSKVYLQPGANGNTTLPSQLDQHSGITVARLKDVQKKKGVLFIAIALGYFDDNTNDLWHTEFCEYWDYNVPPELVDRIEPHLCNGHNGIVGPQQ